MAYNTNPFAVRKPRPLSAAMGMRPWSDPYSPPAASPSQVPQQPGAITRPMAPSYQAPTNAPMAPVVPGQVNFTKNPQGNQQATTPPSTHVPEVGAKDAINQLLGQSLGHAGDLNAVIANLLRQFGTSGYDELAAAHAPEFADINRYYDQGRQRLLQSLQQRGMGDSTAYGTGIGAFEGERAGSLGRESAGIHSEDLQRQDQARQHLTSILQFLENEAGQLAEGKANRKQRRWEIRQGQKDQTGWGDILGALIGSIGGIAGTAGNLGWKPFSKPGGTSV